MILDGRFSYFVQKFKGCTAYGTKQSFVSVRREKSLTADSTLSLNFSSGHIVIPYCGMEVWRFWGTHAILMVTGNRSKIFLFFLKSCVRNGISRASI